MNDSNFSWVKTHLSISDKIGSYKNKQKELIQILLNAGVEEKSLKISDNLMNNIDPFTFYSAIYNYRDEDKRLEILNGVAKQLGSPRANDTDGIPFANRRRKGGIRLFDENSGDLKTQIEELWSIFEDACKDELDEDQFQRLTEIDSFSAGSAARILFYVDPENYLTLDKNTKEYLSKKLNLDSDLHSYTDYKKIISEVEEQNEGNFAQLSYNAWLWNETKDQKENTDSNHKTEDGNNMIKSDSLNTILFGPPGTGKTYNTINKAIEITDPDYFDEHKNDRKALRDRFKELLITDWENPQDRCIAYTTFHQSYSYEDFIEGIKPELNDVDKNSPDDTGTRDVGYIIEDGVFKKLCNEAKKKSGGEVQSAKDKIIIGRDDFEKEEFYKLSLGNSNLPEDEEIYQYCIENNKIAIGFLWDQDLTHKKEGEISSLCKGPESNEKHDCTSMVMFRSHMKKGNYVIISNGNSKFRAVGKITGDYTYNPESPIRYNHFRDVEWIATDFNVDVSLIYGKQFSQKTIYRLDKHIIKQDFFSQKENSTVKSTGSDKQAYVLIIDEINRGNIADIFGELITLIENDKREGRDEELSLSLPYSGYSFSVPSNVYLIGTMNTADRSIEALDTALRRRFDFIEMPPKPEVIDEEAESSVIRVGDTDFVLSEMLVTINERIEILLDKDHLIGHSYFMNLNDYSDLRHAFKQRIIPLLEEYFYGDKGKIQLVLGKGFVEKKSAKSKLAESEYEAEIFEEKELWHFKKWDTDKKEFEDALKLLRGNKG